MVRLSYKQIMREIFEISLRQTRMQKNEMSQIYASGKYSSKFHLSPNTATTHAYTDSNINLYGRMQL